MNVRVHMRPDALSLDEMVVLIIGNLVSLSVVLRLYVCFRKQLMSDIHVQAMKTTVLLRDVYLFNSYTYCFAFKFFLRIYGFKFYSCHLASWN